MERQKLQKDFFGDTKALNKSAHNKYFNYYVYIKCASARTRTGDLKIFA